MNTEIVKADIKDLNSILDILNSATKKLISKNIPQWDYPWDTEEVAGYIQKNEFYKVQSNGIVAGCFGLKPFENNPFADDKNGLYFYHLAVHPQHSATGLSQKICRWIQRYAKSNGVTVYFDCWAGNDFLKKFYTENGFEYIGDFPEEDYFVSAFKSR